MGDKAVFSVRVSVDLLHKTRSCVYTYQDRPHSLTLRGVTENTLKRGVDRHISEYGQPDNIPEGERAGYIGRRPGLSRAPKREIHSVNIPSGLKESVDRVHYTLRLRAESDRIESIRAGKGGKPYFEFSSWFEKHLEEELKGIEVRLGTWEIGDIQLRAGRRITSTYMGVEDDNDKPNDTGSNEAKET